MRNVVIPPATLQLAFDEACERFHAFIA
jgi:hypothetical protein